MDLSTSDPVYNPNKKQVVIKEEESVMVKEEENVEKEQPKQFISTAISFSFAPKKSPAERKEVKPKASNLSSFFS